MPRCFMAKKAGGRPSPYPAPPRDRSPPPEGPRGAWPPRSPTAGETAPSPPPAPLHPYPLDLHVPPPPPHYYPAPPGGAYPVYPVGPPGHDPRPRGKAEGGAERVVEVHIPEVARPPPPPHAPQHAPPGPYQHPPVTLLYGGYVADPRGYSPPGPVALPLTPSPDHGRALTPTEGLGGLVSLAPLCPQYEGRGEPLEEPINLTTRQPTAAAAAALYERPPEDLSTAHAILDLSTARVAEYSPPHTPPSPLHHLDYPPPHALPPIPQHHPAHPVPAPAPPPPGPPPYPLGGDEALRVERPPESVSPRACTVAYTYEAFFVSDGRSKRRGSEAGEKPRYTCSECGKHYATSSNLSRHKQTHRDLDSGSARRCHVCGKAYVSMPALAMHVLTHSLTHRCGVCGKAFSRPWLLQGHMRSHTGEKPFGCAHCGKSFADRSNLRAHMQTHSQLKNFRCKRCNKSFALKSYLNKHYESACFKDMPLPPSSPEPQEGEDS